MTAINPKLRLFAITALGASLTLGLGCDNPATSPPTGGENKGNDGGHDDDHPSEGPHHGGLIELGDEEYHCEFVHDEEAGTVTIYILDSSAKKSVPIESESVTVTVPVEGTAKQFTLKALPMEGEEGGKSSRFSSDEKALGEAIDQEDVVARVQVTIGGTRFSGEIPHHHDHEED